MPRNPRLDHPGAAHHVFNRGIARRSVFENARDIRFALSLFAREVRAGRARMVSYSFLTTHFHALIETPDGDVSGVMQRVMNLYVRRFNRERRRDGPLFRGRFGSRLVDSETYRATLLRYIDQNAPGARLVSSSLVYPFGSAHHYAATKRPRWLDTTWVDGQLGLVAPTERLERYAAKFGVDLTPAERDLVRERMRGTVVAEDPLDDLVAASPEEVRAWMRDKSLLADGTSPGIALAGRDTVGACVGRLMRARGGWAIARRGGRRHDAWSMLAVGLLRDVSALSYADIAATVGVPRRTVMHMCALHREWMLSVSEYVEVAQEALAACLAGLAPRSTGLPHPLTETPRSRP